MNARSQHRSGVPGVSWHSRDRRWRAVYLGVHIGYFESVEDASSALLLVRDGAYRSPVRKEKKSRAPITEQKSETRAPSKRQAAIDAVLNGATHKEAAELVGVAKQTVSNWCWKEGVSVRPRATHDERERAVSIVRSGSTIAYAAAAVGYDASAVGKWVKRRGLESP